MSPKKKGPKRNAKGRFAPSKGVVTRNGVRRWGVQNDSRVRDKTGRARDSKGRFVSKASVRTEYVREVEALRREVERLKEAGAARERDIERNYRNRSGAYERFVSILAIGQQKRINEYLDEVYDGTMSKEDFVTMSVNVGLTVREAWAVLYS